MKAIVFGSGGLLGQALLETLPARGYEIVAAFRGRGDADVADGERVAAILAAHPCQVVFNAAAWTDVDGAEDHEAESFRANALGPEVLGKATQAAGARLVHYSTDFVFDGESEAPYDEAAAASPQSVYAKGKLEGERRALAGNPRTQILRVGCLYGKGGRNFPSTLLRRLRAGEAIRADNDRRVSPTWVGKVADLSAEIARTEATGLFHSTAQGETTWARFAGAMVELSGISGAGVEGVSGAALKLKAARPRRSILISRRLPEAGLAPLAPWREHLHDYLASEGALLTRKSGEG
ncbi:MAG TPA: dTDP-4-dehydrorhamnose reductase [Polyangia bacterium]